MSRCSDSEPIGGRDGITRSAVHEPRHIIGCYGSSCPIRCYILCEGHPFQYTARVATLELHNRPEPLLPLPLTCPHSDSPHVRPLPRPTNDPNSAFDWFECLTCGRLALAAIRLEVRGLPAVRASVRVHMTSGVAAGRSTQFRLRAL